MHRKQIRKMVAIGALTLLIGTTGVLGALWWSIQGGLDKWCAIAQANHPHPGDDVAALMAYVQSESHSLIDRNYAVWALGQARDARALPVLERYYTGQPCDHDRYLCQGELAKAIKLCRNPTPNPLHIRPPVPAHSEPQWDVPASRPSASCPGQSIGETTIDRVDRRGHN